tara:strand:+ start:1688 stop:2056 length:369 start_codon:yes stop_codon:yes gene_type:complete
MEMQKFLGLMIAAVIALGACGGGDSDEVPSPSESENSPVVEEQQDTSIEPEVVEEPTPTAEVVIPTPAPLIHTVQPGNSLSQIAQSYGVPIELLAAENGIEDYNLIQVGQEIVIPLIEDEEE